MSSSLGILPRHATAALAALLGMTLASLPARACNVPPARDGQYCNDVGGPVWLDAGFAPGESCYQGKLRVILTACSSATTSQWFDIGGGSCPSMQSSSPRCSVSASVPTRAYLTIPGGGCQSFSVDLDLDDCESACRSVLAEGAVGACKRERPVSLGCADSRPAKGWIVSSSSSLVSARAGVELGWQYRLENPATAPASMVSLNRDRGSEPYCLWLEQTSPENGELMAFSARDERGNALAEGGYGAPGSGERSRRFDLPRVALAAGERRAIAMSAVLPAGCFPGLRNRFRLHAAAVDELGGCYGGPEQVADAFVVVGGFAPGSGAELRHSDPAGVPAVERLPPVEVEK